jgi:hypothetical protein
VGRILIFAKTNRRSRVDTGTIRSVTLVRFFDSEQKQMEKQETYRVRSSSKMS